MSEFEEFTRAASSAGRQTVSPSALSLDKVAVLGGGADAQLLAALCLAEGADVTLFSAYGAELDALMTSSGITLRGDGPVGTYQVNRDAGPSVQTTAELDKAVSNADVIFLTGPVHKQRTYAMVLADHLSDGQVLVLAPGRSMGALETIWYLRIGGCTAAVTVVEAQNLPFWIDQQGSILNLSSAGPTPAATLPSGRMDVLGTLKKYLPNLEARESVVASGFEDGSALVEIPALLIGGPAIADGSVDIPAGGKPLEKNQTFATLIGDEHRLMINAMAAERAAVAKMFGVRNMPDGETMIARYAGAERGAGSRRIPDQKQAQCLLRDGVIGSLVPLLSAAELAGIEVPVTRSVITLASASLGADVAAAGRRLDTIGIQANDVEQARKIIDELAVGQR